MTCPNAVNYLFNQRSESAAGELRNLIGRCKSNGPWDDGWEENTHGGSMRTYLALSKWRASRGHSYKGPGGRKKEGEASESGHRDGVGKESSAVLPMSKAWRNIWRAGNNHRCRSTVSIQMENQLPSGAITPWHWWVLINVFWTHEHLESLLNIWVFPVIWILFSRNWKGRLFSFPSLWQLGCGCMTLLYFLFV